jgi:hypothetical protein
MHLSFLCGGHPAYSLRHPCRNPGVAAFGGQRDLPLAATDFRWLALPGVVKQKEPRCA